MQRRKAGRRAVLALAALLLLSAACGDPDAIESPPASPPPTSSQPEPGTSESLSPSPLPSEQAPEHDPSSPPPQTSDPAPTATPLTGQMPLGEPVEEDWFSDAVFVGDSRTDGLMLYSGIRNTTFISHQGLSVFNIGSQECIDLNGAKVTALTALEQKQWAKVYLMLGINELGYDSEAYRTAYTSLVQQIRELQPEATLYLQTVLPVNESLAKSKGISSAITNNRVHLFNDVIRDVAEAENTALVDVAEAFWSDEDCIAPENTSDGVHLTRQGYVAWYEYLKSHTGTTPAVEEPGAVEADATFQPPEQSPDEPGEASAEPGQVPAGPGETPGESTSPTPEQSGAEQEEAVNPS